MIDAQATSINPTQSKGRADDTSAGHNIIEVMRSIAEITL
jgi:hypothetical protein